MRPRFAGHVRDAPPVVPPSGGQQARHAVWQLLLINLIVVIPVTILLFSLVPTQSWRHLWRIAAMVAIVGNSNAFFLTAFYRLVWQRLAMRSKSWYVALALLLFPLVAVVSSAASLGLLQRIAPFNVPTFGKLLVINMVLVVTYGVATYVIRDYRLRLAGVSADLEDVQHQNNETGLERDELKLFALQVYLRPHFLFNSLNAVAQLIREDPDKAERTTLGLAHLLRMILEIRGRSIIPLEQEMAIVREYLSIEKVRLGDRLSITVNIPPHVMAIEIPAMVLQPLVENAIQHGIRQRHAPGHIEIYASTIGKNCLVEVLDDGPGVSSHSGMGEAMVLLHERLTKLYGQGMYELTLQRDLRTKQTIASLSIPMRAGVAAA